MSYGKELDIVQPNSLLCISNNTFKFYSKHCLYILNSSNSPYTIEQFLRMKIEGFTNKMFKDWINTIIKFNNDRR